MGEGPDLFTGEKEVVANGVFDYETPLVITQSSPLPMTLLAIVIRYEVSPS
jgi:hypothetical protein